MKINGNKLNTVKTKAVGLIIKYSKRPVDFFMMIYRPRLRGALLLTGDDFFDSDFSVV